MHRVPIRRGLAYTSTNPICTGTGPASGTQLSLAALYLGPVALIAWFFGRTPGRLWCIVVAAASAGAELTTPQADVPHAIVAWNTTAVLMLSLVVVEPQRSSNAHAATGALSRSPPWTSTT